MTTIETPTGLLGSLALASKSGPDTKAETKPRFSLQEMKNCIEQTPRMEARAPLSTYRLQLHAGFTFADAEAVLPYLQSLGIGDSYASPIFEARPGSMHGYDVTRHDRLRGATRAAIPEVGRPWSARDASLPGPRTTPPWCCR